MGMEYGGTRRGQTSRNERWGYDVTPIETVGSSFLTIRDMSGKWETSLPKKDLSKCIEGSLISLAHRMLFRFMVFFQTGPIVFHNFGLLLINDRLGHVRALLRV